MVPLQLSSTARRRAALAAVVCLLAACGPVPGDVATSAGTTSGSSSGGASCGTDTWASYGQGFFASNCASCHGFASSQGSVQANAGTIASKIQSGQMPPGGGLSSADVSRVVAYLDCGAP